MNAIAPGYFASSTNAEALQADETRNRQILEARIPAARWGQPQEYGGRCALSQLTGEQLRHRHHSFRGRRMDGEIDE